MMDHNLIAKAKINHLSLSFNEPTLDTAFKQYAFPQTLIQTRVAVFIGMLMVFIFGFYDAMYLPRNHGVNLINIEGFIIVLGTITLLISFTKYFSGHYQWIIGTACLLAGLALIAKLSFLPHEALNYYYPSLLVFIFWVSAFVTISLPNTVYIASLTAIIFVLVFKYYHPLPPLQLLNYVLYMFYALVIGIVSRYLSERKSRLLFLREMELDIERESHLFRSLHDSFTGLPNRDLLIDRIQQCINFASRNEQICAGIFIDLDNFKDINDNFGHDIGDLFLREVAKRLKSCMRESDTLSRIGGDEFFVLARNLPTQKAAETLAKKLLQQIKMDYLLSDKIKLAGISASIGICLFPYELCTPVDIIRRSDQAMYKIKHAGKSNYAIAEND